MGLFKKLDEAKEDVKRSQELKENGTLDSMIITSGFTLDKPFETIGLIHATHTGAGNFSKLIGKLKANAADLGADAIIGFHAMTVQTAVNFIDQTAYGTAVRYKNENAGN